MPEPPRVLWNRVRRHLRQPWSTWIIRGHHYHFRDEPYSLTPLIVWKETATGFYDLQVQPGETVLEIGGHIGMVIIPWARENPSTRFITYEPNRRNYLNLLANLRRNGIQNVEAVNAGLADKPCQLNAHHIQWNTGGSTTERLDLDDVRIAEHHGLVPGYPFPDILARHGLTGCAVLKIDCEGGEYSLQPGDLDTVETVIMEVHGHLGPPRQALQLLANSAAYPRVKVIRSGSLDGTYHGHAAINHALNQPDPPVSHAKPKPTPHHGQPLPSLR